MVLSIFLSADLYSGCCNVETLHLRVKTEKQSALKPHIYGTLPMSQALGTDSGTWGNSTEKIHDRGAMDNTDEHRCLIIVFPLLADYGPFPAPKITWVLSGYKTFKSFKHKCLSLIPILSTNWLLTLLWRNATPSNPDAFFLLFLHLHQKAELHYKSLLLRAAWTHYSESSFALFKTLSWPGLHSCQWLCTIRTRKHVRMHLKNITDTLV